MGYAYLAGRSSSSRPTARTASSPLPHGGRPHRTFLHEFGHVLGILTSRVATSCRDDGRGDRRLQRTLSMCCAPIDPCVSASTSRFSVAISTSCAMSISSGRPGECEPTLLVNLGIALLRSVVPGRAQRVRPALRVKPLPRGSPGSFALRAGGGRHHPRARVRREASADTTLRPDLLGALGNHWLALGTPCRRPHVHAEHRRDSLRFTPWYNRA